MIVNRDRRKWALGIAMTAVLAVIAMFQVAAALVSAAPLAAAPSSLCSLIPASGSGYRTANLVTSTSGENSICTARIFSQDKDVGWADITLFSSVSKAESMAKAQQLNYPLNKYGGIGEWAGERGPVTGNNRYLLSFRRGAFIGRCEVDNGASGNKAASICQAEGKDMDQRVAGASVPPAPSPAPTIQWVSCTSTGDLRVSPQEMIDIVRFRATAGGANVIATINGDISALARSRGGAGSFSCSNGAAGAVTAPPPPPKPAPTVVQEIKKPCEVSAQEMADMTSWGQNQQPPRSDADIQNDIEALNRSRGGTGTCTAGGMPPPPPPEPAPSQDAISDCDELITVARETEKEKLQVFIDLLKFMGFVLGYSDLDPQGDLMTAEDWYLQLSTMGVAVNTVKPVLDDWELARNIRMAAEEIKASGQSCGDLLSAPN